MRNKLASNHIENNSPLSAFKTGVDMLVLALEVTLGLGVALGQGLQ